MCKKLKIGDRILTQIGGPLMVVTKITTDKAELTWWDKEANFFNSHTLPIAAIFDNKKSEVK